MFVNALFPYNFCWITNLFYLQQRSYTPEQKNMKTKQNLQYQQVAILTKKNNLNLELVQQISLQNGQVIMLKIRK